MSPDGTAESPGSRIPIEEVIRLAEEAGRILRDFRTDPDRALSVVHKGFRDLVTAADLASEDAILAGLRRLAPEVPILSEESADISEADGRAGPLWVVDPLDGTTNFTHGHPLYSVSIALVESGVPRLAVIHAPELGPDPAGRTWSAVRGGGAFEGDRPIEVSRKEDLGAALLATGFSYGRIELETGGFDAFGRLLRRAREIRRGGSACLDLAFTAAGIFDGYWEADLKPHDVAAGALLVREAGGRVTDFRDGDDWLFGRSLVAGGARIHHALLDEVASVRVQRPEGG